MLAVLVASAGASPCGALVAAADVATAVDQLQRRSLAVDFEGGWEPASISFRLPADADAPSAAQALLAACGPAQ